MFETAIAAAMVTELKRKTDLADRRAFYGPDAVGAHAEPRRKVRLPRFLRRDTNVA
jgi:hypothetical protein